MELPAQATSIVLQRSFAPHEMRRIQAGVVPEQMEDKWFIYWHENRLFLHRSWTGFCVYVVHFVHDGGLCRMVRADVNRDPGQHGETSAARDAAMISYLIDILLLRRDAAFPCDAQDSLEPAMAEWSQVGRAMLGQHPRHREDAEPGAGGDSR